MIPVWKFSRRSLLIPLFLCFCCSSSTSAGNNATDAAVRKFVSSYFGSWSKADFAVYRSLFRQSASVTLLDGDQWQPWDLSQFLEDQERIQSQRKMEEVPLSIDIKASSSRAAFVEVAWRLIRTPGNSVTGKDWFTLVKEGEDWKILSLTFWEDTPPKSASSVDPPAEGPAVTKPKIVVSGFEQFAGRSLNASSEIAQAIVKAFPQWDVTFVQVPVVWGAPKQVIARARFINPTIWIAFGEGTNAFRIETVARNTRGHYPDNKNQAPSQQEIDPNGAQQLKLDFSAEALSKRLSNLGYDCTTSSDAGKYLCEEMFYSLLEEKNSPNTKLKQVLFIHVPVYGSTVHLRWKEGPLSDKNLRVAAHDLFETIATVLEIPAPK